MSECPDCGSNTMRMLRYCSHCGYEIRNPIELNEEELEDEWEPSELGEEE